MNARRIELIDRSFCGTLTTDEAAELERLQDAANEYAPRVMTEALDELERMVDRQEALGDRIRDLLAEVGRAVAS